MTYTLPLDSVESTLATTGGKGHNLSILSRGGIAVPGGFVVTLKAYREFVSGSKLLERIKSMPVDDNEASAVIQAAFRQQTLSPALQQEIVSQLNSHQHHSSIRFWAIRSSATCEDMPDASFAGQHDTYLNVASNDVPSQVIECFASLFTARAISYRNRHGLSHIDDAGMAVVCQGMAVSQIASGVLFTSNPLTGRRNESVLEAIPGLGEALVSGLTEPDRYVVKRLNNSDITIKDKRIGAKAKAIRAIEGGGVKEEEEEEEETSLKEVLTEVDVKKLIQLGQTIQDLYHGTPQDIEWTKSTDGKFSIVQSRPITTLFPLPKMPHSNKLQILFSFNSVQGIVDPITPAGQEVLQRSLLGGLIRWITWGRHGHTGEFLVTAAERLFINVSNILGNVLGRKILLTALPGIDPSAASVMEELIADPANDLFNTRGVGLFFLLRLASLAIMIVPRLVLSILFPSYMRKRLFRRVDDFIEYAQQQVDRVQGLSELVTVQNKLLQSFFPEIIPHVIPRFAAGLAPLGILGSLAGPSCKDWILTLTRGLPHNVTTEMDLQLWGVAQLLQKDVASLQHFSQEPAQDLAKQYLEKSLPKVSQTAIANFLSDFGMRGLYEIDYGRVRWREDPTPLMNTLKSYVEIRDPQRAPDTIFAQGERAAEEAIVKLSQELSYVPVSFLASRIRELAGIRELPKFAAIRLMGIVRAKMLQEAEKLVQKGKLNSAKDLCYLYSEEIKALASGDATMDYKQVILERHAAQLVESKRTRLPRIICSDGFASFGGVSSSNNNNKTRISDDDNTLSGEPVSPGVYEGRIRVVHDPRDEKTTLQPSEILCCHGTDPSWTPLFLSAGALVMEVGGLMTHGSVVAREYGIPAVVGLEQVTSRLKTGQLVRVDGSSGMVEIIVEE